MSNSRVLLSRRLVWPHHAAFAPLQLGSEDERDQPESSNEPTTRQILDKNSSTESPSHEELFRARVVLCQSAVGEVFRGWQVRTWSLRTSDICRVAKRPRIFLIYSRSQ
ncbi:hypothetical protein PM082_011755 [Marasmius tenuissimus]|nr:hypothetical protein PM082_011755 [Marasmius tenuissimus]